MPRKGEVSTALPGQRFGRLVVLSASGKSRVCQCDCGNTITVENANVLKSGNTLSCGCLRKEITGSSSLKHGATRDRGSTKAYRAWQGLIQRCTNPKNAKFSRYGGRGITVCERWLHSFEAFHADMGDPPPGHSIDRIDNDGPYAPENCQWASGKRQARNKSTNRVLTFRGKSQTLAEWAEELGIPRNTIQTRLRLGWSVERALSEGIDVV